MSSFEEIFNLMSNATMFWLSMPLLYITTSVLWLYILLLNHSVLLLDHSMLLHRLYITTTTMSLLHHWLLKATMLLLHHWLSVSLLDVSAMFWFAMFAVSSVRHCFKIFLLILLFKLFITNEFLLFYKLRNF